jgi:hypothetical protein
MADVWIYQRRFSCAARYRHGGSSALNPYMNVEIAESINAAGTGTGLAVMPAESKALPEDNVLLFTPLPQRTQRAAKRRPKGRTSGVKSGKRD